MNLLQDFFPDWAAYSLTVLAALFTLALGLSILAVVILYVLDVAQTAHAIRHNYPVIGRFRALFEHLGVFFRQYFFAMDREELPFNRALRRWCEVASRGADTTVAFGSTRNIRAVGAELFVNSAYAHEEASGEGSEDLVIGPGAARPYRPNSFFNISAMSYGSISRPAVEALSSGAAASGCWLNTGEGGLSPYHLSGGCDLVFQIGTAKYGVRDDIGELSAGKLEVVCAHDQVKMVEIKLSQGAKPGKGGILPGVKVTEEIAAIRGIPEGQDSLSPDFHPDVRTSGELLDLIGLIRTISGRPTGIKAVIGSGQWLDDLFGEIIRRGADSAPDFFSLDSADGGTGAAPLPLIDYVGLPLHESLPLLTDKLAEYGLRQRVVVIASGKLITPGPVASALCLGADIVQSARGFMFALGCIQSLRCNRNTCPTGITTHDPRLQRGLDPADKANRVTRYHDRLVYEVKMIAKSCGIDDPRRLARRHARIVQEDGRSVLMSDLFPGNRGSGQPE